MHFGQSGLWSIDVLPKHCPPHNPARCRSLLSRDSSTAFCTRLQAAQPSTRWEMGLIFFALRVSALQMVLMCMSTWLPPTRSEEHTSELQSLTNLVCRLLLEKKK